jgi:hypothetical protein
MYIMTFHRSAVFLGMATLAVVGFAGQCVASAPAASPVHADGVRHLASRASTASFGSVESSVLDAAAMRGLIENYAPATHLVAEEMPACSSCHGTGTSTGSQLQAAPIVASL